MAEQAFTPPTSEWYRPPRQTWSTQANAPDYDAVYDLARQDPQAFWAERAESLSWYRKWDQVLDDSDKPFYKWFVGGKTNMALNALDRHVTTGRRNKLAIIWEGEDGEQVTLSYWRLWQEVNKFANVLRGLGVSERRPRHHLYGPRAGDRDRHAGLRQGRRAPQRRLRRLLRAGAGIPH